MHSILNTIIELVSTHRIITIEKLYHLLRKEYDVMNLQLANFYEFLNKNKEELFIHNNLVISAKDKTIINLINATLHLQNILKGVHYTQDTRFIISALLFYKRLIFDKTPFSWTLTRNVSSENKMLVNSLIMINADPQEWLNSIDQNDIFLDHPIFNELKAHLDNFTYPQLSQIKHTVQETNTKDIPENAFSLLFENLYNNASTNKEQRIGTAQNVVELMTQILNVNNGKVYDPVCGRGTFLSEIRRNTQNASLYGTEIHHKTALFAYMSQIISGVEIPNIDKSDCFDTLNDGILYDFIIADLPIGGIVSSLNLRNLEYKWNISFPKSKSFSALVLFILEKLNNKGRAIFTVSDSFLFKGGIEREIRERLIKEDYIEGVISLPREALKPFTNGKASILVINKAKPSYLVRRIKFLEIDSLPFNPFSYAEEFKKIKTLEKEKIKLVGIDDVLQTTSLEPKNYTKNFFEKKEMLESGKGAYLKSLVTLKSGVNIKQKLTQSSQGIPLIKIENLEREVLDVYLSKESFKEYIYQDYYGEYSNRIIDYKCILVAKVGDYLKPTIFEPSTQIPEIIPHSNVIVIRIIDKEINLEYLYYQFYSSFVSNQVETSRSRSVQPFISQQKLGEIVIPYDNLEFHKKFIENQKNEIVALEEQRVAERLEKIGYKRQIQESETNIIATLTHQLKHSITTIRTYIDKANLISSKNNLLEYKEYKNEELPVALIPGLETPENKTLEEVLSTTKKESDFLNKILDNVQKAVTLELSKKDFRTISLRNLFEQSINRDKNYTIDINGGDFNIEISIPHMKELINGLLNNAEKHGFKKDKNDFKVSFSIKRNEDLAIINYKNNGTPFTITQKEFITILSRSRTSDGSGIGGYYINKIIKAHHGELFIDEKYKSGVSMRIELPLRQHTYE